MSLPWRPQKIRRYQCQQSSLTVRIADEFVGSIAWNSHQLGRKCLPAKPNGSRCERRLVVASVAAQERDSTLVLG